MERTKIESSLITSVGWIDGVMEVEFKSNGEIWRYPTVAEDLFSQMMAAPSIGSFFMRQIRPAHVGVKQ